MDLNDRGGGTEDHHEMLRIQKEMTESTLLMITAFVSPNNYPAT
jgi:hypothetical protein